MKKQILNIGKALNKAEQKQISGGGGGKAIESGCIGSLNNCFLGPNSGCPSGEICITISEHHEVHGAVWDTYENVCVCPLSLG